MMFIDKLIEKLKMEEGIKYKAYKCTAGYLTIGVGRNLETNPFSMSEVNSLNKEQMKAYYTNDWDDFMLTDENIDTLLMNDIRKIDIQYRTIFGLNMLSESAMLVVYDMIFQLGLNGFKKFKKTISYLRDERYFDAGNEIMDSQYAKQTPNRAKRNKELLQQIKG